MNEQEKEQLLIKKNAERYKAMTPKEKESMRHVYSPVFQIIMHLKK